MLSKSSSRSSDQPCRKPSATADKACRRPLPVRKGLEAATCRIRPRIDAARDLDKNLNKGLEEMTPIRDVLDDFKSEALEVYKTNPWLVYSIDIHKKRVFGAKNIT